MSFHIVDHASNRAQAYVLNDFLDRTAGTAVRAAGSQLGEHLNISKSTTEFVATEVCIALQAVMAGARGKSFKGAEAAIQFFVGNLQHAVKTHFRKHKQHFNGHLLSDDHWAAVEGFVATETIAAVHARLRPPTGR